MHFYPGQSVGDYSVVELLGGSGTAVYRVKHALTEREEAIKVVYGAGQGSIADSQQFLQEIRLQARLRHPHITEVMTAFWSDDDLVMVTELPEGKPLRSLLALGSLTPAEAVEVMRQLLDALRYAHNQRVIHGGVSPESILYSPSRRTAKLTDFGLARARADQKPSPHKPNPRGIPHELLHYSAPELLRGESVVDARVDIYACGATLYELFTGHAPYENASESMLMLAIERDSLVPPSKLNPLLPTMVDIIVKKAMKQWPDERYASAEDFLHALEPLAKALGVPNKPVGSVAPKARVSQPSKPKITPANILELPKPVLAACGLAAVATLVYLVQSSYQTTTTHAGSPPRSTIAAQEKLKAVVPAPAPVTIPVEPVAVPEPTPEPVVAVVPPPPVQPRPRSLPHKVAVAPAVRPVATKPPELARSPVLRPILPAPASESPQPPPVPVVAAQLPQALPPTPEVAAPAAETPAAPNRGVVSRVGSGLKKLNPFRKTPKKTEDPAVNTLR